MSHQEPPLHGPKLEQRIVDSVRLTAYVRMFNLLGSIVLLIGVPSGGYLAVRYVNTMDRIAQKQEQSIREFALLQSDMRHTTSDIAQSNKNVTDRMEQGERVLHDRVNQLFTQQALQQQKLDELSKYLYTKVR